MIIQITLDSFTLIWSVSAQKNKQFKTDTLRRALIKVAKVAENYSLIRVHDLRHTLNSLVQMNGVDPATMGKSLGHQDIETTMIYSSNARAFEEEY